MSLELMVRVMQEIEVTRPQQGVLLAMAENANDDGTSCYPSIDKIAWKAGYKPRAVEAIIRDLRKKGILVKVADARAHRPTEYHIHLEKAPKKKPFAEWRKEHGKHKERGAENAPVQNGVPGVHSDDSGVQSRVSGVHSHSNGVLENAPEPSVKEPSNEPSEEERARETPIPDDATSQCLLILKKVKGIGKNYGELAVLLAELREEFSAVDPLAVCKEYELYHRKPPKPTKNHALKLRTFFTNRAKWQAEDAKKNGRPPPATSDETGGSKAAEKRKKDYGWLFK